MSRWNTLAKAANSQAAKHGSEGRLTGEELEDLSVHQQGICLACKEKKELTVDHAYPFCKGGSNKIENIQLLCNPCNMRKGAMSIDYREPLPPGRRYKLAVK